MKKLVLLLLCLIFVLSGCEQLTKAENYYPDTKEDVYLKTVYSYYFDDENTVLCRWVNESDTEYECHDAFELHVLEDGEWYVVNKGGEAVFNTKYTQGIKPQTESNSRYELSLYTDKLKDGKTYRISTYFFDDEGNYYQAFAEFICDNKLAEEEIAKVSEGTASHRENPTEGNKPIVLPETLEENNG